MRIIEPPAYQPYSIARFAGIGINTDSPAGFFHASGLATDLTKPVEVLQAVTGQTGKLQELRNSLGTVIASMGLGTDTAPLGNELINVVNWTYGADWAIDGDGGYIHTQGSASALTQNIAVTNGTTYQVAVTVNCSAGSVAVTFGRRESGAWVTKQTIAA